MKTEKFNFNTKLHKVCSTDEKRPLMQLIQFVNGFAYASNGIIAIKQPIEFHSILNDEILDGKFLHSESYSQILSYEIAECDENGIKCKNLSGEEAFFYFYDLKGEKAPDIAKVIEQNLSRFDDKISNVAFKQKALTDLCSAMEGTDNYVRLRFIEKSDGIIVDVPIYPEQIGLIMKVSIDDLLF